MRESNFTKIKTEVINLKMKKSDKFNGFRLLGYDCLYCSEKHRAREGEKIRTYTEAEKEKTA